MYDFLSSCLWFLTCYELYKILKNRLVPAFKYPNPFLGVWMSTFIKNRKKKKKHRNEQEMYLILWIKNIHILWESVGIHAGQVMDEDILFSFAWLKYRASCGTQLFCLGSCEMKWKSDWFSSPRVLLSPVTVDVFERMRLTPTQCCHWHLRVFDCTWDETMSQAESEKNNCSRVPEKNACTQKCSHVSVRHKNGAGKCCQGNDTDLWGQGGFVSKWMFAIVAYSVTLFSCHDSSDVPAVPVCYTFCLQYCFELRFLGWADEAWRYIDIVCLKQKVMPVLTDISPILTLGV